MNRTRPMIVNVTAIGLALIFGAPLIATTASAQAPAGAAPARGQRGGGRGATMATLPVAAIDTLVTLMPEQKTKIETIQTAYQTDAAATQGDRAKMTEVRNKANEDIKAVLTSDQNTKLTALMPAVALLNQSRAIPYLALGPAKITADQWTKIKTSAKETDDKIAALPRADRQTQRPMLLADFKTAIEGMLTAEQKTAIANAPKARRAAPGVTPAPPAPPKVI